MNFGAIDAKAASINPLSYDSAVSLGSGSACCVRFNVAVSVHRGKDAPHLRRHVTLVRNA